MWLYITKNEKSNFLAQIYCLFLLSFDIKRYYAN